MRLKKRVEKIEEDIGKIVNSMVRLNERIVKLENSLAMQKVIYSPNKRLPDVQAEPMEEKEPMNMEKIKGDLTYIKMALGKLLKREG